ncbi:MAG: hypothetical protein ACFB4I_08505 [Cyanophyceae cyanobacterium]
MTQTPKQQTGVDLQSMQVPPKSDWAQLSSQPNLRNFEIVYICERISQIVAPYFVMTVGVLMYNKNFLLGTVLVVIGLLVMFKITWEKLMVFVNELLKSFGADG